MNIVIMGARVYHYYIKKRLSRIVLRTCNERSYRRNIIGMNIWSGRQYNTSNS
ncbi:hypothetical protein [Thalassobacillus sp. C254]|uniref:hypothetical protein n=1 Tax=Thalassobacillus sp. C254 TaxID=1225341 RepID=UPI0022B6AE2B|nr:hypothetical protein [Thalassobacillus sp. C254]